MSKQQWDGDCICGHLHSDHVHSSSINYSAGRCSKCDCLHFVHNHGVSHEPPPPASEGEPDKPIGNDPLRYAINELVALREKFPREIDRVANLFGAIVTARGTASDAEGEFDRFDAFVNWMYDAGWRPDDGPDYNPHKFLMWYHKGSRDESTHLRELYENWIWETKKCGKCGGYFFLCKCGPPSPQPTTSGEEKDQHDMGVCENFKRETSASAGEPISVDLTGLAANLTPTISTSAPSPTVEESAEQILSKHLIYALHPDVEKWVLAAMEEYRNMRGSFKSSSNAVEDVPGEIGESADEYYKFKEGELTILYHDFKEKYREDDNWADGYPYFKEGYRLTRSQLSSAHSRIADLEKELSHLKPITEDFSKTIKALTDEKYRLMDALYQSSTSEREKDALDRVKALQAQLAAANSFTANHKASNEKNGIELEGLRLAVQTLAQSFNDEGLTGIAGRIGGLITKNKENNTNE